jgi:general secretion pathway protein M
MSRLSGMTAAIRQSPLGRWYYGRERNEQRIITGVATLVIAALVWTVAWKPVTDWYAIELNRQQNAQQLIDWMRANEQAAKLASRSNSSAGQGSRALIPVITKAAVAHGLKLNRLQPESNGVISVVLQQQSFNQIVGWVAQLDENNGVSVERASFDNQDEPGYVNAQLRLN